MTNNDELALKSRETFERWWQVYYHNGNPPRLGWQAWRDGDGYKRDEDDSELNDLWNSWQAAQSSLLAERDADKKQLESWRNLAKKNIAEHEKAVIALDAARLRIRELETVSAAAEKLVRCKGRYHSEQNYRALAALFGVSTPDLPPVETEERELELIVPPRRCFDYAALAVQERDEQWHKALHDACKRGGIKLEVGE